MQPEAAKRMNLKWKLSKSPFSFHSGAWSRLHQWNLLLMTVTGGSGSLAVMERTADRQMLPHRRDWSHRRRPESRTCSDMLTSAQQIFTQDSEEIIVGYIFFFFFYIFYNQTFEVQQSLRSARIRFAKNSPKLALFRSKKAQTRLCMTRIPGKTLNHPHMWCVTHFISLL